MNWLEELKTGKMLMAMTWIDMVSLAYVGGDRDLELQNRDLHNESLPSCNLLRRLRGREGVLEDIPRLSVEAPVGSGQSGR